MIQTEILLGDVVELSPNKLNTIDDFDLEKCTVLEFDSEKNKLKVFYNKNETDNERFFNNQSITGWFDIKQVAVIERDYKVISITEMMDSSYNQELCIVKMARVNKILEPTKRGYLFNADMMKPETEVFIYRGITHAQMAEYLGTTNRINLALYKKSDIALDGKIVSAWKPISTNVDETLHFFSILNVA